MVGALVAMSVAMLATALLGREVITATESIRAWDVGVVDAATDVTHSSDPLRQALLVLAVLTKPWVLYVLLSVVAGVLFLRGTVQRRVLYVVPLGLLGWLLAFTCKQIVARPRPTPQDAITTADGYSYPSGHATNATIATILFLFLVWPGLRSLAARVAAVVVGTVFVALVCADRVFLGVHYLTDVSIGVVVGSVMTVAGLAIVQLRRRESVQPEGGQDEGGQGDGEQADRAQSRA